MFRTGKYQLEKDPRIRILNVRGIGYKLIGAGV